MINVMKKQFFLGFGIIVLVLISGCGKKTVSDTVNTGQGGTSSTNVEQVAPPKVEKFPNDLDRDGIDNATEKQMGLSETEFDTDGDGLSDYAEINTFKTDPNKMDSDGDGYGDSEEIVNGFNPNGPGKMPTKQ